MLAAGFEMGDLLLAYAPRPILLLGQKQDFFDERGLRETYARAEKVYELLGAGDNLQYFIGPTYHGYSIENREAMYGFFNQHAGIDAEACEAGDTAVLAEEELRCTADGQLMVSMPECFTVRDFIRKKTAELQGKRVALSGNELKNLLRDLLHLPSTFALPYVRKLNALYFKKESGYQVHSRFGIECCIFLRMATTSLFPASARF